MTAFWTAAAGLTALAWLMLAMPGRPPSSGRGPRRGASNLLVLKDQLSALNAEFAAGHIDAAEHGEARAEIERRVLEDAADADASACGTGKPAALTRNALLALAVGIPVVAFGLYGFLGNPDGLTVAAAPQPAAAEAATSEEVSPQAVAAMLDDMAKRMDSQPAGSTDAAGWALLGRSNAALQRFGEASRAYARAIALAPSDAQLLADQADVLSMLQDRSTRGEPGRLIARALQIDPTNLKALALAGSDAFERKDFAAALDHWTRARKLAPAGNFADSLDRSVQEARTALGTAGSTASDKDAAPSATVASAGNVGGRIELAPELASRVLPTDTVFVFARAQTGPRMPLAIARYKASDLPIEFKLSDANAMSDALRLSNFTRVVIGARVSRSGDATPGAGDLQGQSEAVSTGRGDVAVTIDSVRP